MFLTNRISTVLIILYFRVLAESQASETIHHRS
jgi:hypothetical protein